MTCFLKILICLVYFHLFNGLKYNHSSKYQFPKQVLKFTLREKNIKKNIKTNVSKSKSRSIKKKNYCYFLKIPYGFMKWLIFQARQVENYQCKMHLFIWYLSYDFKMSNNSLFHWILLLMKKASSCSTDQHNKKNIKTK